MVDFNWVTSNLAVNTWSQTAIGWSQVVTLVATLSTLDMGVPTPSVGNEHFLYLCSDHFLSS